jgi:hypothetical protein
LSSKIKIKNLESVLVIINALLMAALSFAFLYTTVTFLGLADRGKIAFLQSLSLTITNLMRLGLHQQAQVLSTPEAQKNVRRLVVTQSVYLALFTFLAFLGLNHLSTASGLIPPLLHPLTMPLYAGSLLFYSNCSFLVQLTSSARNNLAQISIYYSTLFVVFFAFERSNSVNVDCVFIALIIANSFSSLICLFALKISPSLRLKLGDLPSQMGVGLKIFGWSNLKDLMYRIDILILPSLLDVKSYGHYTVITNLAQSSWRVIDPLLGYYNRLLISGGLSFRAEMKLKMSSKVKVAALGLFIVLAAFLTLIASKITLETDANIVFLTFVFCLATASVSIWKKISIDELAQGRHVFMYKSVSTFILIYLILSQLVNDISSALILASALMLLLSLWAWRLDTIRK